VETIEKVNLEGLNAKQKRFVKKLSVSTNLNTPDPKGSIMVFGKICNCNDAFLCEHRLQFIIDWLKENK